MRGMSGVDLAAFKPHEVLFWSGAGVSRPAPTCGPTGPDLTRRILSSFFLPGTQDGLAELYRRLDVPHKGSRPRLETVLDALAERYGAPGLLDALSDLADCTPNPLHQFFAAHLGCGGDHVTANFDTCVERSGPASVGRRPIHVHGSLGESDALALGARLGVVERGLPEQLMAQLDAALDRARVVVFVGYSGSDFFDVDPYLRSREDRFVDRVIVWHDFAANVPLVARTLSVGDEGFPRFLVGASAEVVVTSGELRDLLRPAARAWGLPDLPPLTVASSTWRPGILADADARRAATIALYARMGYRTGVLSLLEEGRAHCSRDWDRLADALWGAGRYREAGLAWDRAYPGTDRTDSAHRLERRAAVWWIRGRLRAAERLLWAGIEEYAGADSDLAGPVQAALLETYGHVVTHMKRLPDARWLVRESRVRLVEERLGSLRQGVDASSGLHLRARLDSIAADLSGQPDNQRAGHEAGFQESEALHAWLNFRHGTLRRRVEQDQFAAGSATLEDYLRLRDDQVLIGATGDAARVYLLPGIGQLVGLGQVRQAFRGVDVTPYHRLRLIVGVFVTQIRSRRRARDRRLDAGDNNGKAI